MNNSEMYIAPGLPQELVDGFSGPSGTTPPLTPAQTSRVRKYGYRAMMTGAVAVGVAAVGTIVVIRLGKWLLSD